MVTIGQKPIYDPKQKKWFYTCGYHKCRRFQEARVVKSQNARGVSICGNCGSKLSFGWDPMGGGFHIYVDCHYCHFTNKD